MLETRRKNREANNNEINVMMKIGREKKEKFFILL